LSTEAHDTLILLDDNTDASTALGAEGFVQPSSPPLGVHDNKNADTTTAIAVKTKAIRFFIKTPFLIDKKN
jgi:hypothetical protein